jgi:tetratricopeptide (TPR) repeat protein
MEIAEDLHELGDNGGALGVLRESLELRRKLTEGDKDNLTAYLGHGFHFNRAGKLLTRMNRFDEALAAYHEAEQSFQKVREGEPDQITNRRWLATLYLRMGDLHAGLGVCDFARSQNYGGISGYEYCRPDAKEITTNRERLRQAQDYYQKAANLLTEFEAQSIVHYDDKENLRVAREKLATVGENIARRF